MREVRPEGNRKSTENRNEEAVTPGDRTFCDLRYITRSFEFQFHHPEHRNSVFKIQLDI